MGKGQDVRMYRKPAVVSERVFEQAALSCSGLFNTVSSADTTPAPIVRDYNLKALPSSCGQNAS